jgi:hypothetical protein
VVSGPADEGCVVDLLGSVLMPNWSIDRKLEWRAYIRPLGVVFHSRCLSGYGVHESPCLFESLELE